MKLTVLGAGTLVPHADYGSSGHAVRAGDDTLLFDCGSGVLQRAARSGIDWSGISRVFISHFHPDHCLDLPALTFAMNYAPGVLEGEELNLYGPPGLAVFYEKVCVAWPAAAPKRFRLNLRELAPGDAVEGDGWTVRAGRACHGKSLSLAWRVESEGRSLVYSGDTQYCPELVELSRGCGLLLCECSTDGSHCLEGHMSPDDVARTIRESGAKKAVIVHVSPPFDPPVLAMECERLSGVTVIAARDCDSFEI